MAWKTQGDDRIKQYRVYRELEEEYRAVLAERDEALAKVRAKDATIRQLAAELAQALDTFGAVPIGPAPAPEEPTAAVLNPPDTTPPPRATTPPQAIPGPAKAKAGSGEYPTAGRSLPLRERFGGGK